MNKLICLEIKRNRLHSYHMATIYCTVIMLAFQYLMAFIPYLDPIDEDVKLFSSYSFLLGINDLVLMVIFTIFAAVMSSQFIIEAYQGKQAILLFTYPIKRKKILCAKIILIISYCSIAMFLCGATIKCIFFCSESIFPLCTDILTVKLIIQSLVSLLIRSILSGLLAIISLSFGFQIKSTAVTIVASIIIVSILCQIIGVIFSFQLILISFLIAIFSILSVIHMINQVENMEV